MDKLPQISEAEYEIMKIIWDESPISTNSICEKVPSIHNWSNKTVHTLLSRLVSKHVISYEQKGRMYYYFPIISKNYFVNNRRQDRGKSRLHLECICPFLWTAHRFLPIEPNRVRLSKILWNFNVFSLP